MILIETGIANSVMFQRAVALADQLRLNGLHTVLNIETVPEDLNIGIKFEALRFLHKIDQPLDGLILIGAESLDDTRLHALRGLTFKKAAPIVAYGFFSEEQSTLGTAAKLGYVTDREPKVIDLSEGGPLVAGTAQVPCFGAKIAFEPAPFLRGLPGVVIFAPSLYDAEFVSGLQFLTTSRSFAPLCLMTGKAKSNLLREIQPGSHIFGASEVLPSTLTRTSRILVLTSQIGNGDRGLTLLNNAFANGHAVIDATPDGIYEAEGLPVLRGPSSMGYLKPYLDETIFPNLDGIQETTQPASIASRILPLDLLETFKSKQKSKSKKTSKPALHFMPTNGIGLGHAQRSMLVAEALPTKTPKPNFFAFPSCLPMIARAGFNGSPLVARSELHAQPGANDLANFARLRSGCSRGDTFVFDGGYVFDGIFRTIQEHNLKAVWIRRGLWRSTQDNRIPLDREKYFERVIVPSEAFEDLNQSISGGSHVQTVGPIVRKVEQEINIKKIRTALATRFGLPFTKLVVTMLGSGVVQDLSAQIQTVSAQVEARKDCVHLIVVWPSAVVPPERFAWTRSKVVTSQRAGMLAACADVVVSAAGYNSFHEAMYNQIPTIFVPQTAEILDDQSARAETAADLGLCAHVPAIKLSQLDRELRKFLDQDKAADIRASLKAFEFPATGNVDAAKKIVEVMG